MPNEAALKFLNDKIAGLEAIVAELDGFSTSNLNLRDSIRADITSIGQVLFALRSARNSLEATEKEVPPPPEQRVEDLTAALRRLDGFVRSDQQIQAGVKFLMGVADLIRTA